VSEIKHEFTPNAVCPYCGHIDRDSWELGDGGTDGETECGACEKTYLWERNIIVEYSTKIKECQ
jgi:uncharacterized Zn-finger protein